MSAQDRSGWQPLRRNSHGPSTPGRNRLPDRSQDPGASRTGGSHRHGTAPTRREGLSRFGPAEPVDELALPRPPLLAKKLEPVRKTERAQEPGEAQGRDRRDGTVPRPARAEEPHAAP